MTPRLAGPSDWKDGSTQGRRTFSGPDQDLGSGCVKLEMFIRAKQTIGYMKLELEKRPRLEK